MSICKVGSNTKETVIENFQSNVLISESPLTDGDYLVLKPQEFDQANSELSTDLFQSYNLFGTFWVRTNNRARFNTVLSDLTDILAKRQVSGNEQYTNNYKPPISPKTLQVEELSSTTIQQVKQYAKDIATGVRVLERFSQAEQRGIAAGGPNHAAASVLLATKAGSGKKAPATNEEQEALVEQFAKKEGIWVENVNATYGKADASGEESLVWIEEDVVLKSQNTLQYATLQEKLDSITLHNYLFPESKLLVTRFGRTSDGEFQVLVEQDFIDAHPTDRITTDEIGAYMTGLGFVNTEDNNYANFEILIDDLHVGNAIKTPKGNIIIIDPIIRLNTPEQGYGGTRKSPETNEISTTGLPTVIIPEGYENPC